MNVMKKTLTVNAYAKINLLLRICGRFDDGYHRIETIFQEIDFSDTLILHRTGGDVNLEVEGMELPADEDNLVLKAVTALRERFHIKAGVSIHLKKVIPVGAGLGGGSSDAAATLKALNKLWNINIPSEQLQNIASRLGADVSFFLWGGTGLGTGRGDMITPLPDLIKSPLILLKPECSISTAWAYKKFDSALTKPSRSINISTLIKKMTSVESLKSLLINDLEQVVLPRFPEVARLRSLLQERGSLVSLMTGSGSAVFGIFQNEKMRDFAFESFSGEECFKIKSCFASSRLFSQQ